MYVWRRSKGSLVKSLLAANLAILVGSSSRRRAGPRDCHGRKMNSRAIAITSAAPPMPAMSSRCWRLGSSCPNGMAVDLTVGLFTLLTLLGVMVLALMVFAALAVRLV